MLKHVGRIASNKRKIIVAYKVVPGEPENCIVVTTENLMAEEHDSLMKLVESAAGQEAEDLATAMMRTTLPDGSNMLARFHTTGKMVKVRTDEVEMVPNRNTSIMLNTLNEAIASQKGVSVADLAVQGNQAQRQAQVVAESQAANIAVPAPTTNNAVLTDEDLAAKLRSDADRLYKEAAALRAQAEELVPTPKKSIKKTVESA
jgi:hypothetical protein